MKMHVKYKIPFLCITVIFGIFIIIQGLLLNKEVIIIEESDDPRYYPPKKALLVGKLVAESCDLLSENSLVPEVFRHLTALKSQQRDSDCLPLPTNLNVPKHRNDDCSVSHVSIFDGGRLGNNICQYSTLWLMRESFGIRAGISTSMLKTLSEIFQDTSIPVNPCWDRTEPIGFVKLYTTLLGNGTMPENDTTRKEHTHLDIQRKILLKKSYFIEHNPCPRDLLFLYREQIRKEFVFKRSIKIAAWKHVTDSLDILGKLGDDVTLVTVHVRRTDYKEWLQDHWNTGLIGATYFHRAFNFYRERLSHPVFLVASDDLDWCRENLKAPDVAFAGSVSAGVDLQLLSLGQHHVISVGTFGYIGALLGQGIVVYPSNYSANKTWEEKSFTCVHGLNLLVPISAT